MPRHAQELNPVAVGELTLPGLHFVGRVRSRNSLAKISGPAPARVAAHQGKRGNLVVVAQLDLHTVSRARRTSASTCAPILPGPSSPTALPQRRSCFITQARSRASLARSIA
jgi:hypothetical protein